MLTGKEVSDIRTIGACVKYVEDHFETRYAYKNGAYISGRTIVPTGCVNHSVGCAQPSIEVFFNTMNREDAQWGVSAILGDFHLGEGKILITMPLNRRNWGVGKGLRGSWNNTYVQWEICEPAGHTYAGGKLINYDVEKNQKYFDKMWKMLVAWNVYCCVKFGYGADKIFDHAESYRAGFGSNHGDISHWIKKHGKTMDDLRKEVAIILSRGDDRGNKPDDWASEAVEWAKSAGVLLGDENGNYTLKSDCTRQDMIVFLYRTYKFITNYIKTKKRRFV